MSRKIIALVVLSGGVALGVQARADSLTPTTFTGSTTVGGTVSITNKVGTITAGTPTSAQADVFFLTDTTGSMGPAISQIQGAFGSVITSLASLGNVATGVGEYKDMTSGGDPFDYQLDQKITTNPALSQTALNGLSANGGGDDPEQGLYALTQVATSSSTGFRTGSKDIVVITGDAPSHDALNPPAPPGTSVATTAAALIANNVTTEALNASNITGDSGLNSFGQFSGATSIFGLGAAGSYTANLPSSSALTATLTNLIGSAFSTYSDVSLALVGATPSNCSVGLPSDIVGSFNRSSTQTFNFGAVNITGTSAGSCAFTIGLEADGALLATESDSITVGGPTPVPEPSSLLMLGAGLLGLIGFARRQTQV